MGAVLSAIAGFRAEVARDFAGVRADVSGLQADIASLREKIDRQPDLRLIGHQIQVVIERIIALEDKNVRAIAAINDIAKESVTPGEVEALHDELHGLRDRALRHDAHLRRAEEELKLPT